MTTAREIESPTDTVSGIVRIAAIVRPIESDGPEMDSLVARNDPWIRAIAALTETESDVVRAPMNARPIETLGVVTLSEIDFVYAVPPPPAGTSAARRTTQSSLDPDVDAGDGARRSC